jgi:formylglycine-generating enzyme required for sulfatase activity
VRTLFFFLSPLLFWHCAGSELVRVTHARVAGSLSAASVPVEFNIRWQHSFRDSVTWDAAWVFVKYRVDEGPWRHATLSTDPANASVGDDRGIAVTIQPAADGKGVVIHRAQPGTGPVDWRDIRLQWNHRADQVPPESQIDVRVIGIEMVYIPGGTYAVGDGERGDVRGHLHGLTAGLALPITSEAPLTLGGQTAGRLSSNNSYGMHESFTDDFNESTSVTLPQGFPKGFAPFYIMKYELTQGNYAAFLNTLTPRQRRSRNPAADDGPARPGIERYSITAVPPFVAAAEDRPADFLSWMDAAAFADWAALRPITELEFEKAARGPTLPTSGEFAWGDDAIHDRQYTLSQAETPQEQVANPGIGVGNALYSATSGGTGRCWSCLRGPLRAGAFRFEGTSKAERGASFYGVLELSGNLAERTVSIGVPAGRRFDGRHGDGQLNANGNAGGIEVSRWPGSSNTGERSQIIGSIGTGLRGGHWGSPARNLRISDREFAATPDNSRQPTFGYRFARSARR